MKNIVDAVNKILGLEEEIDPKKRTKDTLKGADEPTKQKDDVGPGSDGKSTKVKFHGGPLATSENFKERLLKSINEADEEMLTRYMKSRGYNPETTPKDKKIAITKSNEFKKWLNDHQFEEAGYEGYTEEQLDEMINEVLSKSAKAGDWISDFVHSDDPKFKGKSKAKRKQMALAAYYAKQRNEDYKLDEEVQQFFQEELAAFIQSEEFEQLDEISKATAKSYVGKKMDKIYSADKAPGKEKAKKDIRSLQRAHERIVGNVKTSEEVELGEAKRPEDDSVPFVEPYEKAKPDVKDKGTSGTHTPMSRAKHLARISLKKIKKEVAVKEESELEEGAFSSGALRLTPQGKKKFAEISKNAKSTSTVRSKDEKGTYTSVRVKPAGETEYKEISRTYDKE